MPSSEPGMAATVVLGKESSISRQIKILTVAKVERSGEWVCVRNNPHGFASDVLHEWRKVGCPYLPGRKLRAKQERVKIVGQRGPKSLWFFHRPTLDKIAPLFAAREANGKPYFKKTKAWTATGTAAQWRPSDRFTDADGEWLRSGKAHRYLQCKAATLHHWVKDGCVHLGGRRLRWKVRELFGRDVKYYLVSELDEINANRARLLPTSAQADLILCDAAAKDLGLTYDTLRTRAKAYGLTRFRTPVRGRDGKLIRKTAFLRSEVEALKSQFVFYRGRLVFRPAADPKPAVQTTNPAKRERARAKIGRPPGKVDLKAQQRDKDLLEAWDRGDFGTNKTEAARKFRVDPSYARKIIREHERGKKTPRH